MLPHEGWIALQGSAKNPASAPEDTNGDWPSPGAIVDGEPHDRSHQVFSPRLGAYGSGVVAIVMMVAFRLPLWLATSGGTALAIWAGSRASTYRVGKVIYMFVAAIVSLGVFGACWLVVGETTDRWTTYWGELTAGVLFGGLPGILLWTVVDRTLGFDDV